MKSRKKVDDKLCDKELWVIKVIIKFKIYAGRYRNNYTIYLIQFSIYILWVENCKAAKCVSHFKNSSYSNASDVS